MNYRFLVQRAVIAAAGTAVMGMASHVYADHDPLAAPYWTNFGSEAAFEPWHTAHGPGIDDAFVFDSENGRLTMNHSEFTSARNDSYASVEMPELTEGEFRVSSEVVVEDIGASAWQISVFFGGEQALVGDGQGIYVGRMINTGGEDLIQIANRHHNTESGVIGPAEAPLPGGGMTEGETYHLELVASVQGSATDMTFTVTRGGESASVSWLHDDPAYVVGPFVGVGTRGSASQRTHFNNFTAIPEPTSLAVLAPGLALLLGRRRQ